METVLKSIDYKVINASGGIAIAMLLGYVLYKVLTNDLSHLNESIQHMSSVQAKTNEALVQNAKVIEGNTKILEIIERRIR